MLQPRMAAFAVVKGGNAAHEWEDGALGDVGDAETGRSPRFIVVDGATEAYDSLRWVDQLVTSFVDTGQPPGRNAPTLDVDSMRRWFETMQRGWVDGAPPAFVNVFEERKFHEHGSFATFLGCELTGLSGSSPQWSAVALGDTVLFHVRDGRLVTHFPELSAADFGLNPDGVHTQPTALEHMMRRLQFGSGQLVPGDCLFLATDALAHWIVRTRDLDDEARLWTLLAGFSHPDMFEQFVVDSRAANEMKNDDVTLLRVHAVEEDPAYVVVCL